MRMVALRLCHLPISGASTFSLVTWCPVFSEPLTTGPECYCPLLPLTVLSLPLPPLPQPQPHFPFCLVNSSSPSYVNFDVTSSCYPDSIYEVCPYTCHCANPSCALPPSSSSRHDKCSRKSSLNESISLDACSGCLGMVSEDSLC